MGKGKGLGGNYAQNRLGDGFQMQPQGEVHVAQGSVEDEGLVGEAEPPESGEGLDLPPAQGKLQGQGVGQVYVVAQGKGGAPHAAKVCGPSRKRAKKQKAENHFPHTHPPL